MASGSTARMFSGTKATTVEIPFDLDIEVHRSQHSSGLILLLLLFLIVFCMCFVRISGLISLACIILKYRKMFQFVDLH